MSETSSTILQARIDGVSRADAEGLISTSGMTDPLSIRLVKEAIQFAYSRPASTDIDAMRTELRALCMAKKIFAQTQQQIDRCENNGYVYSPDLQINGCTAAIQSGQWSGKDLALVFNNRGNAYSDKNDYDRAIADFNEAIRLDPKYAFPYDGRGKAYYSKNDLNHAFADFDQAIRLDPKFAGAYNNRGNVYYDKKDYDRAIADYDQAIRLDPEYAFAYNGRANAYNVKNDYDRAIADYDQAIRLDPKNPFPYNGRGGAYDDKKDYDRAIADYDQAIRLDPKYANAYYGRGLAKLKSGDTAGGNADIAAARRMMGE
jgi:tetratricopeptide (TPR) repeat protein